MVANRNTRGWRHSQAGMTFIELVIACAILAILAAAALPVARFTATRQREKELKSALLSMRQAIDRYKDLADHNQIRVDPTTGGYPPDLQTLVKGVPLSGAGAAGSGGSKTIKFLRRIPVDPMTGQREWGMRSVQDDPDSTSWGGNNVFDVFSKSQGTALDGTKYSEW